MPVLQACNAISGIGDYQTCNDRCDGSASTDTTVSSDTTVDGVPSDVADVKDASCSRKTTATEPGDLEGCPCDGDPRPCAPRVVGTLPGLCSPGVQSCGAGTWGPCLGATIPTLNDVCFDGRDNNCDGLIDDHCKCGDGRNLCRTADDFLPSGDHPFINPSIPPAGSQFEAYFVSTEALSPQTGPRTEKGCCFGASADIVPPGGIKCDLDSPEDNSCTTKGFHAVMSKVPTAGSGSCTMAWNLPQVGPHTLDWIVADTGSGGCNESFGRKVPFSFSIKAP